MGVIEESQGSASPESNQTQGTSQSQGTPQGGQGEGAEGQTTGGDGSGGNNRSAGGGGGDSGGAKPATVDRQLEIFGRAPPKSPRKFKPKPYPSSRTTPRSKDTSTDGGTNSQSPEGQNGQISPTRTTKS